MSAPTGACELRVERGLQRAAIDLSTLGRPESDKPRRALAAFAGAGPALRRRATLALAGHRRECSCSAATYDATSW
jgi:hypothetical protein